MKLPIKVSWYTSDCRVIHWAFDTYWTWDDYYVSFRKLCELANSVDFRVNVIAEVQHATMLPRGALAAYKVTAKYLPQNVRSIAVVGANVWMRAMVSGLAQMDSRLGEKIFFAETRFQAQQLLCGRFRRTPVIPKTDRASQQASSELMR